MYPLAPLYISGHSSSPLLKKFFTRVGGCWWNMLCSSSSSISSTSSSSSNNHPLITPVPLLPPPCSCSISLSPHCISICILYLLHTQLLVSSPCISRLHFCICTSVGCGWVGRACITCTGQWRWRGGRQGLEPFIAELVGHLVRLGGWWKLWRWYAGGVKDFCCW